ncbi:binding-protein-dependent transport systems inner membrane component [Paenibacillus vortex V453]|jgi:putative aldouronate transport system permease protein|uniref:ABC transporter permease n=2 Tax=Paenibacillus TaxID=44249 RepID=A0A163KWL9_9BACL|nr:MULTISPECIES: carbohydrate ABC transporter permease [Paenibacillus]ANA81549.1 ABC transporter permease [Paenibacillus glucanolyticus]AVV59720.1 carbohydrate ABC transporter permease [Paenibacillus glucanolyticus]AWP28974.1 ABC transporter permease [Paenibacillus sp. Cedars]EFU41973.1 binding-protein-dependent transport systems inner membrane component [Paenibacillus vortex V453]ETT30417.1 binding-protein-dependent transport systems inner membrane component [Paenibacillus sp. FSL R5-808]
MVQDKTISSRIFDIVNYTLLSIIGLVTILPFLHVIAGSFTTVTELAQKQFVLFPTVWSLDAYKYVFSTNTVFRSLGVSVGVTFFGTLFSMLLTCLMAYGLSRRDLDGRNFIMFMVLFTMLFSGGMIPTFLVVKEMGLIDTYAALIVPTAINAFNLIIMRNFFQNLPEGLEESAKIDGAGDWGILFRIVIPLSMPAIATISLFYAVTYWNTYMSAILYLNDAAKWPVQVILRQIVILASGLAADTSGMDEFVRPPEQTVKMAVIVIATLPILCVYPFLQKHFAKGALLGSIKG